MFKDPTRPKKTERPMEKKDPYFLKTMSYDNRSGGFIRAGQDFGTGIKQPVGHMGNPKETVDTMPMTSKTINGVHSNEDY